MKKLALMIGLFAVTSSGWALDENFAYQSGAECRAAMNKYHDEANDMVRQYEPFTEAWTQAMNTQAVFWRFANDATHEKMCDGPAAPKPHYCYDTISPACGFSPNKGQEPWASMLVPLLTKEVNNIRNKTPDTNLSETSDRYVISCKYPAEQDAPNWDQCKLEVKHYDANHARQPQH